MDRMQKLAIEAMGQAAFSEAYGDGERPIIVAEKMAEAAVTERLSHHGPAFVRRGISAVAKAAEDVANDQHRNRAKLTWCM